MQAGRLAVDRTVGALDSLGLNLAQFAALALICRLDGITQVALGERLGISKSAVSRVAISLVEAGLATHSPDWRDGRRRALYATAAGAELAAKATEELVAVNARLVTRVGEDAIRALSELAPPNLTPVEESLRAAGWLIPG